jgi:hypothetical protein
MEIKVMEIKVNSTITWQRSCEPDAEMCVAPVPTKTVIPQWFGELRGNLSHYTNGVSNDRTARHCLGLRGAMNLGWTIPWSKGYVRGVPLQADQLHGSIWAEQLDSQYKWHLHIMCWPWRICLPHGWRLLMNSHPLVWSNDWFAFSGCVDANYHVTNGTNIGSFWNYNYPIDSDCGYFNIENVMAFKEQCGYDRIAEGTPLFSAIPIYDPDYQPKISR